MKRITVFGSVILILLAFSFLSAQTVNVTFRVNTATIPDTISTNAAVQVRGGTAPLTWGNDTGGQMTNIGGDYWEVTLQFNANATSEYKFFANAAGDGTGNGWEAGPNLNLTVGTQDTILPLHYFRNDGADDPFAPPYTVTDSMDVWFRVNVHRMIQYGTFNPATQVMGIRGGTSTLDWGNTIVLEPEPPFGDAGQYTYPSDYFWSGHVKIVPDSVDVGDIIYYKFVYGDRPDGNANIEWESVANRELPVTVGKNDTTVQWVFWNNVPPDVAAGQDTVEVKFTTDLTRAITEGGFTPGDTIYVQYGDNGTSDPGSVNLIKEGFIGNIYSGTDSIFNVQAGGELQYNYYVMAQGTGIRENYFDFSDTTIGTSRPEKRKLDIPSPAPGNTLMAYDTTESQTDPHRQPQFRNNSILPKNVTVYYEV
ncbi:MAG: hypothetical protein EH225_06085, partial [Calditrichaeota bacterium]